MGKHHQLEMEAELTEVGKKWLQEPNPQGIVWEYAPDKPFKLHSMAAQFAELTYLGILYRIPHTVDGKPTIGKAIVNEESDKG